MIIKNAQIGNDTEKVDIVIQDGKFKSIKPAGAVEDPADSNVLNLDGKMILPPFIESHVHLDATRTAGEPHWNMSGTLFEGIATWAERKESLTKKDVMDRARETIRHQAKNGVGFVRTHVDVTDPKLTALDALLELKEELKDIVTLQIVAFPQEGILSFPHGKELMEKAMELGADVVGAIPHFEFTREYGVESLNYAVELAEKYDALLDAHCDEIDDEQSRFVETLATRAYESGHGERMTASHTTAMGSYNGAYASRLFNVLTKSHLNIVSNPLVNIHLQGRFDDYPKRRGLTRVKELVAAGVNVAFGHDDIFDPWYPLGDGNMRDVVHMGLHVAQMMGYPEIQESYRFITDNAAQVLQLTDYGIAEGNSASFIVLDAPDWYTALNEKREVLYHFEQGRLIAETKPHETTLHF